MTPHDAPVVVGTGEPEFLWAHPGQYVAADFVRDEPELVEMYASNLPAFDFASLDLEQRVCDLHRAYVWPGWLGHLYRRLDDVRHLCGVLVGWW